MKEFGLFSEETFSEFCWYVKKENEKIEVNNKFHQDKSKNLEAVLMQEHADMYSKKSWIKKLFSSPIDFELSWIRFRAEKNDSGISLFPREKPLIKITLDNYLVYLANKITDNRPAI